MNEIHRIGDHGCKTRGAHIEVFVSDGLAVKRQLIKDLREDCVLFFQSDFELLAEDFWIKKILNTQTYARRLVGIRRTDATLRGADFVLAKTTLSELVEFLVIREDQMRVPADLEL